MIRYLFGRHSFPQRTPTRRRPWLGLAATALSIVLPASLLTPPVQAGPPVLSWSGHEKDPHPRLYVTAQNVARAKSTREDLPALAALTSYNIDGALDQVIAAALLTDNAGAQKEVVAGALKAMDALIGQIPRTTEQNVGPHAYSKPFGVAVGLADAALALPTISAEDRAALVSKIAKACYLVNDPKYFSPESPHGSLCPNMFTSAAAYRLTLAALIPSHPEAKKWFDGALAELRQQLADWVDPQGGMAETPHYSMVIFDQWVGAFLIAKNAGADHDGSLFDPKLRQAMEWFGNISTPRDPQNNGFRRWPTVGHTYANERTGEFGLMACLWKDKDPKFAAEMQWMHLEHGAFGGPGILSYYPAFMGYRGFFENCGVEPKPPAWTSQYYQETGVQLRNTLGSDRETTLYLVAGRFHSHYFNDSGSIVIWGKGSELCDDDDYQNRRNPESREAHSMPDKPATYNEERVMELREFSTSADFDYVSGVRRGWQRQIAFVKDQDPLGPNYFVIADTLDEKSVPTLWRLFLRAEKITPTATGVTVTGKEDVDLDIIFLRPARVKPTIHPNHISLAVEKSGTVTVLLYPRLRSEAPPKVKALADGQGLEITTPAGTDIVYLSPAPVKAKLAGKGFEGKVALLKQRQGQPVRVEPGACDIQRDWWPTDDPQLRQINWPNGPQYPVFPDYEDAFQPNAGNRLVLDQKQAAVATDFRMPHTGAAPKQSTTVAVDWNAQALEIVFTCADTGIVDAIRENDNIKLWKDDSVYVWLDPGHTHNGNQQYVMIQVSASGAWHDLRNGDAGFNVAGLKTEVSRSGAGWTARLQIPWQGLGVQPPKAGVVWGVNFSRMDQPGKVDHDNMQMSSWVAIPFGSELTTIDRWGHLLFATQPDGAEVEAGRQTLEDQHQAVTIAAYSKERLLK